jgi:hypothetical protein
MGERVDDARPSTRKRDSHSCPRGSHVRALSLGIPGELTDPAAALGTLGTPAGT